MKVEKLDQDTIDLLFSCVFPHMSNLVIFNLTHFCVGLRDDADGQFREALNQELFRRVLLKTSKYQRHRKILRSLDAISTTSG